MNAEGFWKLFLLAYNQQNAFVIVAPRDMHSQCPFDAEPITRTTEFSAGRVYVADSFDDVSGQADVHVHLFVWNTRIPVFRARIHLSPRHGFSVDAWLDGEKVTTDEFFTRPVGICPAEIYGHEQADQFADEWGWRYGMIYVVESLPYKCMQRKIKWSGANTFDALRNSIENEVGRRRMLWIYFPCDRNGVLFFQETNPLLLANGGA